MFRLNPNPQAHKVIRTNLGNDRLQPVVPTCCTTFAYANLSERQSEIVRNNYQLLDRRLALHFCEQTRNRVATQVHERLGFGELCNCAFNLTTSDERTALATANRDSFIVGQFVNQHESQVMTRPL